MTTKQVASLVDEAIALDRQIADLETLLTQTKARLVTEAERLLREREGPSRTGHQEATPTLAGCSYTLHGAAGNVATVNFPKPKLISGFFFQKPGGQEKAFRMKESKLVELGPVRQLAGEAFGKLFSQQYKPVKAFRDLCTALLGKREAAKLIEMCEEPSSPRVSFETKVLAGPATYPHHD
jgi:hypothetical protein